jgi:hypothetical protein
MKAKTLFFFLATGSALIAQPAPATAGAAAPGAPTAPINSATPTDPIAHNDPATPGSAGPSDNATVPGGGFPASRYEALWTKSPFAVATSEAGPESPDYMLVGIANVEGISYASLIDAHNQDHFLISSDKPTRGLTLTSITRSHDDTYAAVQKDGQSITLKLEQAPVTAVAPGAPPTTAVATPGVTTQQLPLPGSAPSYGGGRPPSRFRRPTILLPPAPAQQPAPAPAQPAATLTVPPPPQ